MSLDTADVKKTPPDGVIRFEVDKFSTLEEDDSRNSKEVEIRAVPWRVEFDKSDPFCIFFACMLRQSTPFVIEFFEELTIFNEDSSKNDVYEVERSVDESDLSAGGAIMTWTELTNGGFIIDDKLTVQYRIWITKMRGIRTAPLIDFTDPSEPRHDVAFVIGGEKIYAGKQILALHSPVFNSMFYGDSAEKNKRDFELENVDREEFKEMLHFIYLSKKNITDDSAMFLLKLACRFQIALVIERAEDFVIESDDIPLGEKLLIADKYRLFGLQKHCISLLKSTKDFKDLEKSGIYSTLSDETVRLLFDRLVKGLPKGLPLEGNRDVEDDSDM